MDRGLTDRAHSDRWGNGQEWYKETHKYNNLTGDGETTYKTTHYSQNDELFDTKKTYRSRRHAPVFTNDGGVISRIDYEDTYLTQGKLSRARAKAEKYVYDTFLKKNSKVKQYGRSIDKGLKAVKNLID